MSEYRTISSAPERSHAATTEHEARSRPQEARGGVRSWLRKGVDAFNAFFERHPTLVPVRRVIVAIVGTVLILGGLAIGWIPGPGGFIALIGLAMLAAEFHWVRRIVRSSQAVAVAVYCKVTGRHPTWALRIKQRLALEKYEKKAGRRRNRS